MKNSTLDIDYSDLHWGKYDSPIAQYIDLQVMGNGDFGDEEESDGEGNGMARFGRRIQWWNDQGFVGCDTFDDVGQAITNFEYGRDADYYATCEKCGEKVHKDWDSWYEHEKDECGEELSDEMASRRYAANPQTSRGGVAWRIVRHYPARTCYVAVMVGDNQEFEFDYDELSPLEDDEYCSECGQIGCTADGR